MYFVYLLKSLRNGKSYTGSTSLDVGKRLEQHNVGSNKWTKNNGPFRLIYCESYICKEDAILREKFYKTGIGKQIRALIVEKFTIDKVMRV